MIHDSTRWVLDFCHRHLTNDFEWEFNEDEGMFMARKSAPFLKQLLFLVVGVGMLIAAVGLLLSAGQGDIFNIFSKASKPTAQMSWTFDEGFKAAGWRATNIQINEAVGSGEVSGTVQKPSNEAYLASPKFYLPLVGPEHIYDVKLWVAGGREDAGGVNNQRVKVTLQYITADSTAWDRAKSITQEIPYGEDAGQTVSFDLWQSEFGAQFAAAGGDDAGGVIKSPKKQDTVTFLRLIPVASGSTYKQVSSFSLDEVRLRAVPRPSLPPDTSNVCPLNYAPVCCDGKTYSNQCMATKSGASNCSPGACKNEQPTEGACKKKADCPVGQLCLNFKCTLPGTGQSGGSGGTGK